LTKSNKTSSRTSRGDARHCLSHTATVATAQAASFLEKYISAYRAEYGKLTEAPPSGAGFPLLRVSPYLDSRNIVCWILLDGYAIIDSSREPDHRWWVAGGPALCVDYEPTQTPVQITEELKFAGLHGKPIGIYRIVSQTPLPPEVWLGKLPDPEDTHFLTCGIVHRAAISLSEFISRLTFGALGYVLDLKLPTSDASFWVPHIVRDIGFFNAERRTKRFLNYLETSPHLDPAAWDERAIFARVQLDLRRDFALAFGAVDSGGSISFGENTHRNSFFDRLTRLAVTIGNFRTLLSQYGASSESVFHDFLSQHTILLDVYGHATSKPRFHYPEGQSPLGKAYVEPDFILKYPDNTYKLVELERPSKEIATAQGHPRSSFTQAAFQIAEWRHFIANHYERIKEIFPGISNNPGALLVIGRSTEQNIGSLQNLLDYKAMLRAYLPNTDVYTYDDLLRRAEHAYIRLQALSSMT
jgi:Shedu protein SduA, C-terminal